MTDDQLKQITEQLARINKVLREMQWMIAFLLIAIGLKLGGWI